MIKIKKKIDRFLKKRSKWNSNKFSYGSYSYIKMGSSIDDCKKMNIPLNNKLYFSGEATNVKFIGKI